MISVNIQGDIDSRRRLPERKRFCCEEHAAGYLIRCAQLMHPGGSVGEAALVAIERAIKNAAPFKKRGE